MMLAAFRLWVPELKSSTAPAATLKALALVLPPVSVKRPALTFVVPELL